VPHCTGSTWAQSKSDKERFSKAEQERQIMQARNRAIARRIPAARGRVA
jgi:hypothetical protein